MTAMAMTADEIFAHPALARCVRGQAQALLSTHASTPRIGALFATQQRWLMSHAGLAQYFRNEASAPGSGLMPERFLDLVVHHGIASRNTAVAFLKEAMKYGIVRYVAADDRKRRRPFEPAPATTALLFYWHVLHLATLDGLDGGARSATFSARPHWLGRIQPVIADGLLASRAVREPDATFSLFTWVNEGGIVMDRLIAGCGEDVEGLAQIPTDVTSISGLAQRLNLSRTQLGRKLAAAAAMGSLGWTGARGRSPLWVSSGFRREYLAAQAAKLAIVDAAYQYCCARDAAGEAAPDDRSAVAVDQPSA